MAADAALLLELCPTPPPPPPSAAVAAEGAEAEEGVQSGPQSSLQTADLDPLLAAFKEHKESDLATSERLAAVYDAVTADEAPCGHARPTRSILPRSSPASNPQVAHRGGRGGCRGALAEGRCRGALHTAPPACRGRPLAVFRDAVVAARVAMPTSLQEDEDTLEEMAGGGDPRARAVLEYRAQRKRQLLLAENILNTYAVLKAKT